MSAVTVTSRLFRDLLPKRRLRRVLDFRIKVAYIADGGTDSYSVGETDGALTEGDQSYDCYSDGDLDSDTGLSTTVNGVEISSADTTTTDSSAWDSATLYEITSADSDATTTDDQSQDSNSYHETAATAVSYGVLVSSGDTYTAWNSGDTILNSLDVVPSGPVTCRYGKNRPRGRSWVTAPCHPTRQPPPADLL